MDNKNGKRGDNSLGNWEFENDFLPETLVNLTPNNGRHFIFKKSGVVATRADVLPGLDSRADGGFVLLPGSKIGGREYRIYRDGPIADAPDALVKEINGRRLDDRKVTVSLSAGEPVTAGMLRDALAVLDPESRDVWMIIGGAIHHAAASGSVVTEEGVPDHDFDGLALFDEWSSGALYFEGVSSYTGYDDCETLYWTMKPKAGGVTVGTLFHMARKAGWCGHTSTANSMFGPPEADNDNGGGKAGEDNSVATPWARFRPQDEAEQDSQPDPEWVVEGTIQEKMLHLIYGPENSFKSFVALDLVLSAAAGLTWADDGDGGGFPVSRPMNVVYVAGEGAAGIKKKRRPAWRKSNGIPERQRLPFHTVDVMPCLANRRDVEQFAKALDESTVRPDLLVIDTLANALGGDYDENSAKDVGAVVANLRWLIRKFDCAVVVIAHTGKDVNAGPRGNSAIAGDFDVRFRISASGRTVTMKNEKMKDGEEWPKPLTFHGEKVFLGEKSSSLAFRRAKPADAPVRTPQQAKEDYRVYEVRTVLERLRDAAIAQGRAHMPPSTRMLAESLLVWRLEGDEELQERIGDASWSKDQYVRSEMRKLQREAKTKKGGRLNLLSPFVLDSEHNDLLWALPGEIGEADAVRIP